MIRMDLAQGHVEMSVEKLLASMLFKSVSLTPRFSPSVYQSITPTLSSKDFKEGCSDGGRL